MTFIHLHRACAALCLCVYVLREEKRGGRGGEGGGGEDIRLSCGYGEKDQRLNRRTGMQVTPETEEAMGTAEGEPGAKDNARLRESSPKGRP